MKEPTKKPGNLNKYRLYHKPKIKHFVCLAFALWFQSCLVFSQNSIFTSQPQIIYLEALGAGGYGSANYEIAFISIKNFQLNARGGIGAYRITDPNTAFNPDLLFPIGFHATYGRQHKAETAAGITFSRIVYASESGSENQAAYASHLYFYLAYRYQKKPKGLFFRVAYTPILEYYTDYKHWAGFSLGYILK